MNEPHERNDAASGASSGPEGSAFPLTRWTLVRRATNGNEPKSFEALSQICQDYWYPLYAFVRGQGAPPDDARDEVQGFFAALLEKDFLSAADRDKGKLRTFLLTALKRFRAKEYRARQAEKRGGAQPHFSIDPDWAEDRFGAEPVDTLTPEQILDRTWARLLLDTAMNRLAAEFSAKEKAEEFAVLNQFLAWNSGEISYAQASGQLGITEANLKIRVHRMRGRFRALLEEAVRETVDGTSEDDLKEEMRHLIAALG